MFIFSKWVAGARDLREEREATVVPAHRSNAGARSRPAIEKRGDEKRRLLWYSIEQREPHLRVQFYWGFLPFNLQWAGCDGRASLRLKTLLPHNSSLIRKHKKQFPKWCSAKWKSNCWWRGGFLFLFFITHTTASWSIPAEGLSLYQWESSCEWMTGWIYKIIYERIPAF